MAQNPAEQQPPKYGPDNVTLVGETDIELDEFTYSWIVENYSVVSSRSESEVSVTSPVFHGGPKYNHAWQIVMYPKKKIERVEYISLFLRLVDFGEEGNHSEDKVVTAYYQFVIVDADGRPSYQKGDDGPGGGPFREFKLETRFSCWGYDKFILFSDLIKPARNLLVDDSLKIRCKIWVRGEMKGKVINGGAAYPCPSVEKRIATFKDKLATNIGKLLRESIGTDVTIETDKRTLKAHKAILMARSSVFAAMFTSNMLEKQANKVKILDFADDVVEGMLKHLYTGKTDCMTKRGQDLLRIADKYDLPGLKEDCEYQLTNNLSKENAAAMLILANNHNAPYLKQKSMDFINLFRDELLKSKSFQDAVKAEADTDLFADLYFSQ